MSGDPQLDRAMAEVGLGRSLTAFLTPSPLSAC
jgi:hypothetical protein